MIGAPQPARPVRLDAYRQPSWLRRIRWSIAAAAILAPLVAVLLLHGVGRPDIHQAGPLTDPHRMWSQDCGVCHQNAFGTLTNLLAGGASSTPDSACLQCHSGPEHHADAGPALKQGCAECHREHRGEGALVRKLPDRTCTVCHADLQAGGKPSTTFATAVPSWNAHPEFALLAPAKELPKGKGPFTLNSARVTAENGKWRDANRLKFNHKAHLGPHVKVTDSTGASRPISCVDCHRADTSGRHMQPISFERDCRSCHESSLAVAGGGVSEVVPHRAAEVVRGHLRERLTRLAMAGKLPGVTAAAEPSDEFPGRVTLSTAGAKGVEELAKGMESRLLRDVVETRLDQAGVNLAAKDGGCRKCHDVVTPAGGLWEIVPPGAPGGRWMAHAEFGHESHRMLDCAACHQVKESVDTGDILLPSIKDCRSCHGDTAKAAAPNRSPAPSDCITCHRYHHTREPMSGPFGLDGRKLSNHPPKAAAAPGTRSATAIPTGHPPIHSGDRTRNTKLLAFLGNGTKNAARGTSQAGSISNGSRSSSPTGDEPAAPSEPWSSRLPHAEGHDASPEPSPLEGEGGVGGRVSADRPSSASRGSRPPLTGSGNPSPGSLREPPSPSRGEGPETPHESEPDPVPAPEVRR